VTPPELKQAIGMDVLQKLEQQTGLSQEELLADCLVSFRGRLPAAG